jgi:hypothetical protein
MSRIDAESTESEPENGDPESSFTFGDSAESPCTSDMFLPCSALAANAVIEIGTSWMLCARF